MQQRPRWTQSLRLEVAGHQEHRRVRSGSADLWSAIRGAERIHGGILANITDPNGRPHRAEEAAAGGKLRKATESWK